MQTMLRPRPDSEMPLPESCEVSRPPFLPDELHQVGGKNRKQKKKQNNTQTPSLDADLTKWKTWQLIYWVKEILQTLIWRKLIFSCLNQPSFLFQLFWYLFNNLLNSGNFVTLLNLCQLAASEKSSWTVFLTLRFTSRSSLSLPFHSFFSWGCLFFNLSLSF